MAKKPTGLRKTTLAALVSLPPVIAVVIYSSFQVSDFECTVCVDYEGRQVCRSVTAESREEGLRAATDNACALLTSGMTDSIRCGRTPPTKAECTRIAAGGRNQP